MDNIKYSPGVDAALRYLAKKREEREGNRRLLPWVVGAGAVWLTFLFMYYGY